MTLWLWLGAPLIGLLLALFGAGGGMLTVPLLTFGLGMPLKQAVAMSLWIVALVSLSAAVHQKVWRVLRLKLLLFFASGGIVGSLAGSWLGLLLPEVVQQTLFALLLLIVAWWLQRQKATELPPEGQPCHCLLALLAGALLGLLTGVLGVGGGFLMVPVLIALGISHFSSAVAHSLVLICLNALVAGLSYLHTMSLPTGTVVLVAGLALAGSLVGGAVARFVPLGRLQQAFGYGLWLVGVAMLMQLAIKN